MHHYWQHPCYECCPPPFAIGPIWEGIPSFMIKIEQEVDFWMCGHSLEAGHLDGPSRPACYNQCIWGGCCTHKRVWRTFWTGWWPRHIGHCVKSWQGHIFLADYVVDGEFHPHTADLMEVGRLYHITEEQEILKFGNVTP